MSSQEGPEFALPSGLAPIHLQRKTKEMPLVVARPYRLQAVKESLVTCHHWNNGGSAIEVVDNCSAAWNEQFELTQ